LQRLGAKVHITDILENSDSINNIRKLISENKNGKSLILCDNGDKIKELELYGSALKSGDYILIHDYASGQGNFDKLVENKEWFSWESDDAEILPLCQKYGIEQVYRENFDEAVWFCGRKL